MIKATSSVPLPTLCSTITFQRTVSTFHFPGNPRKPPLWLQAFPKGLRQHHMVPLRFRESVRFYPARTKLTLRGSQEKDRLSRSAIRIYETLICGQRSVWCMLCSPPSHSEINRRVEKTFSFPCRHHLAEAFLDPLLQIALSLHFHPCDRLPWFPQAHGELGFPTDMRHPVPFGKMDRT